MCQKYTLGKSSFTRQRCEAPKRDTAREGRHGPLKVEELNQGQVFHLVEGGIMGGRKEKEESKRRNPSENPRSDLARERASRKRASISDGGGGIICGTGGKEGASFTGWKNWSKGDAGSGERVQTTPVRLDTAHP